MERKAVNWVSQKFVMDIVCDFGRIKLAVLQGESVSEGTNRRPNYSGSLSLNEERINIGFRCLNPSWVLMAQNWCIYSYEKN